MAEVKWYVRNSQGQVFGQLTEEEVVSKIQKGLFLGQEVVSRVSEGKWFPITQHPPFFDAFVDELKLELEPVDDDATEFQETEASITNEIEPPWKRLQAEQARLEKQRKLEEERQRELEAKQSLITEAPAPIEAPAPQPPPAIEEPSKDTISMFRLGLFTATALLVVYIVVNLYSPQARLDKIRLKHINFSSRPSTSSSDALLKEAIVHFRRHTVEDYQASQDLLVTTLEADGNFLDAMGFLCMVYKELWPHTYQDSKDIEAIQSLFQQASIVRANSSSAGVCYVVYQWIIGEYEKAENYMEDALRREPSLLFFNQLSGDLLEQKKKYATAIYYFQKVKELWPPPPWLKPVLQEARTQRKLKKYNSALNAYLEALKYFPNHPHVLLELGVLEFEAFKHIDKARGLILKALQSQNKFTAEAEAEAYFVLAQISQQSGNKKEALNYANKSFSIDSGNSSVKAFILNLGGRSALESVQIDSSNMLYLGTQYMKVGNYFAAQAEFRAAYEADPRNALAAYHAGKALWELNQSNEARRWVERAIQADPNLVSAYVTLAEYYTFRHDYEGAAQILKNIRKKFPQNNEIYRGFALIEYNRGNLPAAIKFAERALSLYPMDTDALQIVVKSHIDLKDYAAASKFVERTLEVDPHTPEVHALYAKIMVGLHGPAAGIDYLQRKIEEAPQVLTYKRALVDILMAENNWSGARPILEMILAEKKDDKDAIIKLALTYKKEAFYNKSLEMYLTAASLDPLDPGPLFLAGELYLETGNPKSAVAQFERVLKINKRYPKVYYYLGKASLRKKDYARAIEMAEMEKKMNPNIAEPYILAAEAHAKLDQFSKCASEYQKAILRRPQGADIYIKMAHCYRRAGALDSAIAMLDQAAQRESGNPVIYKELGAVYHMQGLLIEAHSAYDKYLNLAPNAPDKGAILNIMSKLQ